MDSLTLDQFMVFISIVETGSFAAAARQLGRAQSAVTYAIQKLEDQSGVSLFDRAAYRPTLTAAGHLLLPRARRIIDDVGDYRLQARSIVSGLEPSLSIVIDAFLPILLVMPALRAFHFNYPSVSLRITVEWQEVAVVELIEDRADLGVFAELRQEVPELENNLFGEFDLVAVAAPDHPLALLQGPIEPHFLRDHLQVVVANPTPVQDRRDHGVMSINRWHVTDHHTKLAMLLAGLGWGSLPRPLVAAEIANGRLVELSLARWENVDRMPRVRMFSVHRKDKPRGPAARWLLGRLSDGIEAKAES